MSFPLLFNELIKHVDINIKSEVVDCTGSGTRGDVLWLESQGTADESFVVVVIESEEGSLTDIHRAVIKHDTEVVR